MWELVAPIIIFAKKTFTHMVELYYRTLMPCVQTPEVKSSYIECVNWVHERIRICIHICAECREMKLTVDVASYK